MAEYEISLHRLAVGDINGIYDYICDTLGAPDSAKRTIDALENDIGLLGANPRLAPRAKDKQLAALGYRTLVSGKYLIFYKVDDSARTVTIHRVVYGKRDILPLF